MPAFRRQISFIYLFLSLAGKKINNRSYRTCTTLAYNGLKLASQDCVKKSRREVQCCDCPFYSYLGSSEARTKSLRKVSCRYSVSPNILSL